MSDTGKAAPRGGGEGEEGSGAGGRAPSLPAIPPGAPPPERDPHSPLRHGLPSFDGIRELDSHPPKLWSYIYILTFLASLWIWAAYPAWPWFGGYTRGLLGWSSRGDLAAAVERAEAQQPAVAERLQRTASPLEAEADPELRAYAIASSHVAFGQNCAPCHGQGGRGGPGFPNLADRDWLWGGTPDAIEETLRVGIRWPGNDATRISQMPAFGAMRMLERRQVLDLVEHVRALSGAEHDAAAAARGAPLFADNCASCHGERGEGRQEVGAPRLDDDVWLYGGGREAIFESIWNSRSGVMPAFGGRLSDDTIRKLVLYVRGFGGGE